MKVGLALVGGGLANSLIAHRLLDDDPKFPLVVIERQPSLGGHHTWSFHDSDLTASQRRWLKPMIVQSWPTQELRFPRRHRAMDTGYNSVSSDRLHEVVSHKLGDRCMLDATVTEVSATRVTLDDGTTIEADAIIDGRGHSKDHYLDVAFQKFVGLFLRLEKQHELSGPILMDATVDQLDGYRFVYTLPFSSHELLVEDTYYSDAPDLDTAELPKRILAYVSRQGWVVAEQTGMEAGVLPIVLGGDIDSLWRQSPTGVARSGMRAVLFHPTTGYSLPDGVRLADAIAELKDLGSGAVYELTKRRSMQLWREHAFFRLLNRMLFRAARPEQRYRIFERFYGLRQPLIERFYAGHLKWSDKLRLLTGRPPVPIHRALRCLFEPRRPVADARTERKART
jgi:lycopene beta-cyclase